MSCINNCTFTGRLTADPELKTTPNGKKVCTFAIACERGYGENKRVYFPTLTAWNGHAEFVSKLSKGTMIAVVSEMTERTWTDRQNKKHHETEFIVREVQAMESKKTSTAKQIESSSEEFEDLSNDDDLPF